MCKNNSQNQVIEWNFIRIDPTMTIIYNEKLKTLLIIIEYG